MSTTIFAATGMQSLHSGNPMFAAKAPCLSGVDHLSDEELIRELQEEPVTGRSEACLGEIFRRYQAQLTTWCLRFSRDREYALDLTQEVFLKAFVHLHTYRGDSKVSTWLYAITRNHCLAFLRRRRLTPLDRSEGEHEMLEDCNAMKAFEAVENEQLLRRVRRAISTALDPVEAQVVNLHYMQGLPLEVITQSLALTNTSGAKAYLLRARRKLVWTLRKRRIGNVTNH